MPCRDKTEAIRETVFVNASLENTFVFFTGEMNRWWPREYTWSRDKLVNIGMEPRKNGRCFEKGPFDFHCDWGRIVEFEPPRRLVFLWQISPRREPEPDPDHASEVSVRFTAEGTTRTRVELIHCNFGKHGEGAAAYRNGLGAARGWRYILECFAAQLDHKTTTENRPIGN